MIEVFGRGHGSWFGVPAARLPGSGDGQAAGGALSRARLATPRYVVLQRGSAFSGGGPAAGASWRLCEQGGGGRSAGGAFGRSSGLRARAEGGGVAGSVAGVADVAAGLDQPWIRRACPWLPGPVSGRYPAGGAVACGRAGHVHRDHPRRGGAGPAGEPGDAATDPCHLAGRAERGGPRGADRGQPGPVARVARRRKAAATGVDPGYN